MVRNPKKSEAMLNDSEAEIFQPFPSTNNKQHTHQPS